MTSRPLRDEDMLASGLPEIVADDEDLARFLTSRSRFNAQMAKPAAFLPAVNDRETSVFRHGSEPRVELWSGHRPQDCPRPPQPSIGANNMAQRPSTTRAIP